MSRFQLRLSFIAGAILSTAAHAATVTQTHSFDLVAGFVDDPATSQSGSASDGVNLFYQGFDTSLGTLTAIDWGAGPNFYLGMSGIGAARFDPAGGVAAGSAYRAGHAAVPLNGAAGFDTSFDLGPLSCSEFLFSCTAHYILTDTVTAPFHLASVAPGSFAAYLATFIVRPSLEFSWNDVPIFGSLGAHSGLTRFASDLTLAYTYAPVPEPSALALTGLGLAAIGLYRRRPRPA